MDQASAMPRERGVMRWGGLAGVVSAFTLLITFGIVGIFVGVDALAPAGLIERFPEIRPARIVENGLYLAVIGLWFIHLAALHQATRAFRPAAALFGRVLATLGLAALAAGALPHIATTPISDFYHAPGATPEQQATLVLLWHATQGIFDALLVTGLLVLTAAVITIGLAMRSTPAYGPRIGSLAVALGAVGFGSALVNLVEVSGFAAISVFALIAFNLVVGWRTYRASGQSGFRPELPVSRLRVKGSERVDRAFKQA